MSLLPEGYRLSRERVPVPGAHITEAISLEELMSFRRDKEKQLALVLTDGSAANMLAKTLGLLPDKKGDGDA
jgi:hypothetical protein